MIALYTDEEFKSARNRTLLKLQCSFCGKEFLREKNVIQCSVKKGGCKYCSRKCRDEGQKTKVELTCEQCGKTIYQWPSEVAKYPHHFCGLSCAAVYRNTHKTWGVRRSKLEAWIEESLTELYPDLEMHFNRNDAIESELDIYIPSLKLAFELNGIFHYEPIYGEDKLANIQNNDDRKFQACLERGIEMCSIDTMGLRYFKEDRAQKYLDIIVAIIEKKMSDCK